VLRKPRLSAWKTLLQGAGEGGEVDSAQRAMKTSELKPGYKTTEFWGTIVFHLANLSLYVLGTVEADWAVTASGIVQAVYSIARGMAKR
jgi:hypothetical protein